MNNPQFLLQSHKNSLDTYFYIPFWCQRKQERYKYAVKVNKKSQPYCLLRFWWKNLDLPKYSRNVLLISLHSLVHGSWERGTCCLWFLLLPLLWLLSMTHPFSISACFKVIPRPGQTLLQGSVLCLAVLLVLFSSQKVVILLASYSGLRKPNPAAWSAFPVLKIPGKKWCLQEDSAEVSTKNRSHEQALMVMSWVQGQMTVKMWSMV